MNSLKARASMKPHGAMQSVSTYPMKVALLSLAVLFGVSVRKASLTRAGGQIEAKEALHSRAALFWDRSSESQALRTTSYYKEMCVPTAGKGVWAPEFYPIPRFRMSMGDEENECKYVPDCEAFSAGTLEWPEAFVIQTLLATLGHCPFGVKDCYMADFGGNVGYVNSYAAALGSNVVSVEPQRDLWAANVETVKNNCWDHRVQNLFGMVTLDKAEHGREVNISNLWRPGMVDFKKVRQVTKIWIGDVLARNPTKHFDLIKIDIDSIDEQVLEWLLDRVEAGDLSVRSIIIEARGTGKIMHHASRLGYSVYQLDHHLRLRFFDHRGADMYKLRGCPAPVAPSLEENFCRRGIQYMVKMTAESEETWEASVKEALSSRGAGWENKVTSWLLTQDTMSRPSVMESLSKSKPPPLQGLYRNTKHGYPGEPQNPSPIAGVLV